MRRIWFVLWVVLLLGLMSCRPQHQVLRIGIISPSIDHLPVSYAMQNGLISSEDIMVIPFVSGWETQEALIAGRLDVAILPFTYIWNAAAKGYPVKTVSFFERETDGIVVQSGINSVNDLQGKKIGLLKASSLEVLWMDYARTNGINAETIYFHSPNEIVAALRSAEIDAGVLYVPILNKLEDRYTVLHWFSDSYPKHPCCDLAVNTKNLAAGKEKYFKRFYKDLEKALGKLETHDKAFQSFAEKKYSLDSEQLKRALQHTGFRLGLGNEGIAFQTRMAEYSREQGYLERIPTSSEVYLHLPEH